MVSGGHLVRLTVGKRLHSKIGNSRMNQNAAERGENPVTKMKSRGAFGTFSAITIGALIIVASIATSRRVSYLLYYLNWHHWPWWYAVNLWIVATGTVINCFINRSRARRILCMVVLTAVLCVTFIYSDCLHPLSYRTFCFFKSFYFTILRPHLYTPVTEFFSGGGISISFFIFLAVILVAGLFGMLFLHYNAKERKNKPVSEQEGNRHD